MAKRFDVIVIGVGGMGSAAVYHAARRGQRVLGLERFDIPHTMGSSHGITRIIRLAYHEHPSYVPLLRRAYELWRELQALAGEQLLYITGSLDAGTAGTGIVERSRQSCDLHGLPYDLLTGTALSQRFPGFRLPGDAQALFQPNGGFLLPERCIVAHTTAAEALGAEVHRREQVLAWEPMRDGVRVRTGKDTYEADHLIVTAGAWAARLLPWLHDLAVPERQVLGWFEPRRPVLFGPDRFPVFILEVDEGLYYGLPVYGVPGVKIGRYHHLGEQVDPDTLDRQPNQQDEALLRDFTARYLPDAAGPTSDLKTCMFTNSPDGHFIIDVDRDYPQVSFGAGFSGHGFKFCSVVGEILADLALQGETRHDTSLFRLARFE